MNSSSPRRDYVQAVEGLFVELRGAPFLLSPADWRQIRRWYEQGIPLLLVESTIREVFARRAERIGRPDHEGSVDRINGLAWCAGAVERAWRELQEIQGPAARAPKANSARESVELASGGEPTTRQRLEALGGALPAALLDVEQWRRDLVQLASLSESEIEETLARLDDELLAEVEAALPAPALAELESTVEGALQRVRDRFTARELDRLRQRLRRQHLRRLGSVPRLSLLT